MTRLRVFLAAVVPEVLRHRRMMLSQRQGKALIEMVMRSHTVGDGPRVAQENVTVNIGNHRVPRFRNREDQGVPHQRGPMESAGYSGSRRHHLEQAQDFAGGVSTRLAKLRL
jgi:hypothetical protein